MDMYASIFLAHYLLEIHKQNVWEGADLGKSATRSADRAIAGFVGAVAAISIFVVALNLAA